MENASKALLIAAGVLVGLILISMIIYGYNQVISYYKQKEDSKVSEQLIEFNRQYDTYNRNNVRGSELITLVNKILDYNALKIDDSNRELEIEILIKIPNVTDAKLGNKVRDFYYNYSKYNKIRLIQLPANYTQDNINSSLINEANKIELEYPQGLASKLANNMSTLMGENSRKTKKDLLVELKMMNVDDTRNPDDIVDNNQILRYYQYQQFKRAHFNCENLTYEQGRVKSFTFKFNGTFE